MFISKLGKGIKQRLFMLKPIMRYSTHLEGTDLISLFIEELKLHTSRCEEFSSKDVNVGEIRPVNSN